MPDNLYLRKANLLITQPKSTTNAATGDNKALDLSDFHYKFNVLRGDYQTPNSCDLRIYNLTFETINKIRDQKYTQVILQAGYGKTFAGIFNGTIVQFLAGRENATDTYVDITAIDGDEAYNYEITSKSYPGGTALIDIITGITSSATTPITVGTTPKAPAPAPVRGTAYFGRIRRAMAVIAKNAVGFVPATAANYENVGCIWYIDDGKLHILPAGSGLSYPVTILNSNTGLIGLPEQTEQGIKFRCLLNPLLRIGSVVKLDNTDIQQYKYGISLSSAPQNQKTATQTLVNNTDGYYYVMYTEHEGDTRGQEWYTSAVCLSAASSVGAEMQQKVATAPYIDGVVPNPNGGR